MNIEACIRSLPENLQRPLFRAFTKFPSTALVRFIQIPSGRVLLRQGQNVDRVYVLLKGSLTLTALQPTGSNRIIHVARAIQFIGEYEAICSFESYTATAVATHPCQLIAFSASDYLAWLRSDITIAHERMRSIALLLAKQLDLERHNSMSSSKKRLINYLCEYYEQNHSSAGTPLLICATRSEIGDSIACSVRTVNRQIAKLSEVGFLTNAHKKLWINNAQYLKLVEANQDS